MRRPDKFENYKKGKRSPQREKIGERKGWL
jgi:hypothetical protein